MRPAMAATEHRGEIDTMNRLLLLIAAAVLAAACSAQTFEDGSAIVDLGPVRLLRDAETQEWSIRP